MPGNGIGDRVHNSFDQESLSRGQRNPKVVEKNWQGLSNNTWGGSPTQNGVPQGSNLKNFGVHQSANMDNGHGLSPFQVNKLNSGQPNLRSEVAGSHFLNQQALNGFMPGHAAARQYEANFLGAGVDSYQNPAASKGLSVFESQHGNGPDYQKKDFGRFPNVQHPASFNAFGSQEQMGGQHPALLQSMQRQQSGMSDMQLLQQQMIVRQLQDTQRHQFQQQGVWQQSTPINLLASMGNQPTVSHSPAFLNGIPVHDSSDKSWPELLGNNSNRQQLGASAIMHGSSSGFELPPEQSQALRSMGLGQQCEQSLYGVPVPGSSDYLRHTSHKKDEKPAAEQMSPFGNSFSRSQHAAPSDHNNNDVPLVSRPVGSAYNFMDALESSNLQQSLSSQRNGPTQEFHGKPELTGLSDKAREKSQNVATLDPAEEKILFGSDDNLWEAFGGEINTGPGGLNMPEGNNAFGGFSSLQSGSWCALMQSALAETSSAETGRQEEWSGSFRSAEPTTINQQPSNFGGGVNEQPSAWAGSGSQGGSGYSGSSQQWDRTASQGRTENLRPDSFPRFMRGASEGHRRPEPGMLSKSSAEGIPTAGKADNSSDAERRQNGSGTWTHQQGVSGEGAILKTHSSERLQPSQSNMHNRQGHEVHVSTPRGPDSFHGLGGAAPLRQDSSSNNAAINPSSSRGFLESTQLMQSSQNFNLWRQVDSSAGSRGTDGWGKGHLIEKGFKMESPGSSDLHERQNSSKRENSSGSFPSNVSRHASPGSVQENTCLESSYSRHFHGGKDNSSSRTVQKPGGVPKFQYHPMGDLDVDVDGSRRSKSGASPQASIQQGYNKFSLPGGSGNSLSTNKTAVQPSQNMLELLNKLDHSRDRGTASHFSSSDRNDAHEPETSDGSVGQLQWNQSPASQGFGLQLAPPSQRLNNIDRTVHSQNSTQTASSPHISSERPEVGQKQFGMTPSNQSIMSSRKETYVGENKHNSGASEQSNDNSSMVCISGFPFSRTHLQKQRDVEKLFLPGQPNDSTLHKLASHSKMMENFSEGNQPHPSFISSTPDFSANNSKSDNASAQGAQTGIHHAGHLEQHSQGMEVAAMSHPLVPDMSQQNFFSGALSTSYPASSSGLKHPFQANDNGVQKVVGSSIEQDASISFKPPEASRVVGSASANQNYSLFRQMQAAKSAEVDPSDRSFERFAGPEIGVGSQTAPFEGNQFAHGHGIAAVESKSFDSPGNQGGSWDATAASLHMDALRQSGSPNPSFRSEHSQVPTWISQPGTLKNGQVLQVLDQQKIAAIKHVEQAQLSQKPADSLQAHEPANQCQADSDASPVGAENISSQHSAPPEGIDQILLRKQKKRKVPAPEVQAWHKELTSSAKLHSASTTEIEWSRAVHRLVQKMEDEPETNEDVPSLRPKKRLTLTTQLMQQLLRPPPAPFLAGDARTHFQNVTYCVSKLALGDACRAIQFTNDTPVADSSEKSLQEKPKAPKRDNNEDITKAMEGLLGKTKKLENELLRLDQRSSMVDLRVELQDIERFSIINRFARFHGRSQNEGTGASSSDPMGLALRPMPQKYVMPLAMPRNLPDSVQCLSL